MKSILIYLLLTYLCVVVRANEPAVADAKPQNGVFFTYTGHMTTVIELKDGHFRYWFESDFKFAKEPRYPLTGEYTVSDNTITLKHDEVSQRQWTFRTVDSLLTLWRLDAIESFSKKRELEVSFLRRFGVGGILVSSDKPAEYLWTHRGPPSL
jgi:hypothetical protein